jgi:hypothetical protein
VINRAIEVAAPFRKRENGEKAVAAGRVAGRIGRPFSFRMSDNSPSHPATATARSSKRGTILVTASALFVVAMLLYLERVPGVLHWPMRLLFVASLLFLGFAAFRKLTASKIEAKKVLFTLILAAFMYGALFVICLVFVKLMSAKDEALTTAITTELTEKSRRGVKAQLSGDSPVVFDREIGWVQRPGYSWKGHSISKQGLRGTKEYPETPADPAKRILCIGDSFTFGYEVGDDQAFPHHGEQLKPGTEWINLGNCGSGLTQSLLQYRKNGRKFGGKYVVIGFMTNNNKRTVNCFRPFVSPDDPMTPLTQPYAKFSDGKYSLEPNPYQALADYEKLLADEAGEIGRLHSLDYLTWSNQQSSKNPVVRTLRYVMEKRDVDRNIDVLLNKPVDNAPVKYRPSDDPYGPSLWHPKSPGFQANAMTFDLYYNEVIADGRVPIIVVLPSAQDVVDRGRGRPDKHAALMVYLKEKGYRCFDFLDSLQARYPDQLTKEKFYVNTHFNGETNRFLAEEIIKALELP